MVTITPFDGPLAVGDVLTCNSDSAQTPIYTFSNVNRVVTDGNKVTMSEEGSFSFTCTATVPMDKPCSATASVSETAVGKKRSNNDSLTTHDKLLVVQCNYLPNLTSLRPTHLLAYLYGTLLLISLCVFCVCCFSFFAFSWFMVSCGVIRQTN